MHIFVATPQNQNIIIATQQQQFLSAMRHFTNIRYVTLPEYAQQWEYYIVSLPLTF